MKTIRLTAQTLFFWILFLPIMLFSQEGPQNHVVILNVNTQKIKNPNIEADCNFGQDPNVSNKEYTIDVRPGDFIIWQGLSMDDPENDIVRIVSVDHESGSNFFGTSTLEDNGQGEVLGEVKFGLTGQVMKYTIKFTVFNGGEQRNGTFVIDPKIKIR